MTFSPTQLRKLRTKPHPKWIRSREKDGIILNYLEGAYAIAEANRILGFDAWDRETLSNDCVWSKQIGSRYCAAYVARVRITIHTADRTIVREACGAAEALETTPGAAHERACKAAETDATKRALCTLGNAFGLALYTKPPNDGLQPATPPAQSPPKNGYRLLQPGVEQTAEITTEN